MATETTCPMRRVAITFEIVTDKTDRAIEDFVKHLDLWDWSDAEGGATPERINVYEVGR